MLTIIQRSTIHIKKLACFPSTSFSLKFIICRQANSGSIVYFIYADPINTWMLILFMSQHLEKENKIANAQWLHLAIYSAWASICLRENKKNWSEAWLLTLAIPRYIKENQCSVTQPKKRTASMDSIPRHMPPPLIIQQKSLHSHTRSKLITWLKQNLPTQPYSCWRWKLT